MQEKAKAENERLAKWFGDRRGFYASESHGKRLEQLEAWVWGGGGGGIACYGRALKSAPDQAIESVTVSELVQPPLPESIVDEKLAIDFLYRAGSWLRGAFKQERSLLLVSSYGFFINVQYIYIYVSIYLYFNDPKNLILTIWAPFSVCLKL